MSDPNTVLSSSYCNIAFTLVQGGEDLVQVTHRDETGQARFMIVTKDQFTKLVKQSKKDTTPLLPKVFFDLVRC